MSLAAPGRSRLRIRSSSVGSAIGLGAAFFMADLLASILFGVEPRDVAVFLVVPLVLAIVAVAAVFIPAHRASRADPLARCGMNSAGHASRRSEQYQAAELDGSKHQ